MIYQQVNKETDVFRPLPAKAETVDEVMENLPDRVDTPEDENVVEVEYEPRREEYVKNYLIFGIEEIGGAKNTDSVMIASVNTKDNSIKLTSLLRDTIVKLQGGQKKKLNEVYARFGVGTLIDTVERNYLIRIDGYAHINFSAFEDIIDYLGGITIELGEEEAKYLNTTNYISNRAYRNVVPGKNKLNGNQVLGYCRVRKCVTLGGANNDYGRSVRHRRVMNAVFEKYKSSNLIEMLDIMNYCLNKVTTNLTAKQIEALLEQIVENRITKMDTFRIPVDGMFDDPEEAMGFSYPLLLDWKENVKAFYQFLYLDTEAEAKAYFHQK